MKGYFFLLALSGTAWIANLFCNAESFCFHEGIWRSGGLDGMKKKMDSLPYHFVGNSDCTNLLCLPLIEEMFPNSKAVVVQRDLDLAIEDLKKVDLYDQDVAKVVEGMYEALVQLDKGVLVVELDDLFQYEVAEEVRRYCGMVDELDEERFNLLKTLNVTTKYTTITSMKQNASYTLHALDVNTKGAIMASLDYFRMGGN